MRKMMLGFEALPLGGGKLGQARTDLFSPRLLNRHRHEIRIGEITIVRRLFLAALAERRAPLCVPAAGLLRHFTELLTSLFPLLELAPRLVFDRLLDAAKAVEVFDLDDRGSDRAALGVDDVQVHV